MRVILVVVGISLGCGLAPMSIASEDAAAPVAEVASVEAASAAKFLAMTPQERVRRFVAATNTHDVDYMVSAVNADFRWLQVEGAQVVTEVVGAEQLRSWLDGYFQSTPSARSAVGEMVWDGGFLTAIETASWDDANGQRQRQRATSIYRFDDDGRIEAVWYFPAQPIAKDAAP